MNFKPTILKNIISIIVSLIFYIIRSLKNNTVYYVFMPSVIYSFLLLVRRIYFNLYNLEFN